MSITKIIKALIPHLLGWGLVLLIIYLQNDLNDWDGQEYFIISVILSTIGIVAYVNLYLLIPRFLFKKNYLKYIAYCFVLVIVGSSFITFLMTEQDTIDWGSRLVVFTIVSVFVLLITSSGKFLFEYLKKMIQFKEIENKQLKNELTFLKSQVNPHFLFNTLNNLYGLISQNQNQKAAEITLKLADLMRYLLESSKTNLVSLQKEIQFLEDYLSLEKIRLSQDANIRFEVSGINRDIFIAPLLFIPLVENAFKHGLNTISVDSFAHFSLSVQDNEIYFEAINSVEKSPEDSEKRGTGIENLKKRLQLIYPDRHQLDIEQTTNQFKVILRACLEI